MKIHLTVIRILFFYVAFALIIIGSLSVIQHWSHGRLILCAGLLLATIMFVEARNRQKTFRIITQVLLVVTAAYTLIFGALFFIQNWQAGTILLGIGILLSLILLLDMLVTKKVF